MINNMKTILSAVKQYVESGIKKSVPDWNENNSDSINYIRNKTHGIEYKEKYLIPEQTVTIDEDGGYTELDQLLYFTEGETYTAVFNGTTYECVAWNNGEDTILIGNRDIYGGEGMGDTDIPFSCDSYEDGSIYVNVAKAGTYTISISGIQEVITKIDEKYLPEFSKVGKSGTGKNSEIFNDYIHNIAEGEYSHAEGYQTTASGYSSHAEGDTTIASGERSHAEGYRTIASGSYSHTEGENTTASNAGTHAEGKDTTASGLYSHAEGLSTTASRYASHAEGDTTTASGSSSHAEGQGYQRSLYLTGNANSTSYKVSSDNSNIKIGRVLKYNDTYAKITNYNSSTLTITTDKTLSSTALSNATVKSLVGVAYGDNSHAEGYRTMAFGESSHTEGNETTASGKYSHAEGGNTIASGDNSHVEGNGAEATGKNSHAEGYNTIASGENSHAEGSEAKASGNYSHAEGCETHAKGNYSHAEGKGTIAVYNQNVYGKYNIYEDLYKEEIINVVTTNSLRVFLEKNTKFYIASSYTFDAFTGKYSLTNPISITSSDLYNNLSTYKSYYIAIDPTKVNSSFYYYKFKENTKENNAIAKLPLSMTSYNNYNYSCSDVNIQKAVMRSANEFKYAHIVGNGTSDNARSNAHTLDWDGNAWFQGNIYVGGTGQDDENAKKLATEESVTAISTLVGDKSVATQISEAMANAGGGVDADTELITIADIDEICGATV